MNTIKTKIQLGQKKSLIAIKHEISRALDKGFTHYKIDGDIVTLSQDLIIDKNSEDKAKPELRILNLWNANMVRTANSNQSNLLHITNALINNSFDALKDSFLLFLEVSKSTEYWFDGKLYTFESFYGQTTKYNYQFFLDKKNTDKIKNKYVKTIEDLLGE